MEFLLEDGYKIKIYKSKDKEALIAETYDNNGNFLERNKIFKEDIYIKLFC